SLSRSGNSAVSRKRCAGSALHSKTASEASGLYLYCDLDGRAWHRRERGDLCFRRRRAHPTIALSEPFAPTLCHRNNARYSARRALISGLSRLEEAQHSFRLIGGLRST